MDLHELGWNDGFQRCFDALAGNDYTVGRVAAEFKHLYRVYYEHGELLATVSGKLRHTAQGREAFPAVGDWVAMTLSGHEQAVIHDILPRKSKFSRKAAGLVTDEQIVAANIDTVFLVNALNHDFNARRIERYLTLTWDSGASPVVVLTKADLCDDVEAAIRRVEEVAIGVAVHAISCVTGEGLDELAPYIATGHTVALLGSSGAGKSTIVNRLLGTEVQRTQEVRQGDDRGRHTTTYRELIPMPGGGLLIDTPGMRELQLWGTDEGLADAFGDITQLASQCRFHDCSHRNEPGCAVQEALRWGRLDPSRYENYVKLQKEQAYLARKENIRELLAEKNRWKKIISQYNKAHKR